MSDETKKTPEAPTLAQIPRSMEQIQQEYMQVAAQLGGLVFQIELMKQQRDALYGRIDALNKEARDVPKPPPAAPAPKLAAVPPPPKGVGSDGT